MPQKRSKFHVLFNYKCPRCHLGDLFTKPFRFNQPLDMPDRCSECGQKFEPEPGFYYGAMFISYIVSAFALLGIAGICIVFLKMSVNAALALVVFIGLLSYFKLLRLARAIWLNIVVAYDPHALDKSRASP